jgi:enoyl-CoA hydratase/carnithine racemase
MRQLDTIISSERIGDTPLLLTRHNPGFWQVSFDNPPLNLFNPEMLNGLEYLADQLQTNAELKVVVFDSMVSDFYMAHFDNARGGEILTKKTKSGLPPWTDVAQTMYHAPVITIASIRGRTRGVGIEFVEACDLRFASREKAIFGQLEVGLSTIPGGGSMEYSPLLMGRARAMEMILGADDLDAGLAERYGLVNRALPDAELDEFVYRLAMRISRFDKFVLAKAKEMINARVVATPSLEHAVDSRKAFIECNLRPERKGMYEQVTKWGIGKPGDFELNVGKFLERIGTQD